MSSKNQAITQKDLFGRSVKKKKSNLEIALAKYDSDTFDDRLERLKYVDRVFPKGYHFLSELEVAYLFNEAKMTFIDGNFVATILVAQSYIEQVLQGHLESKGYLNEAKKGLENNLKFLRKNGLLHEHLLKEIDHLRKVRNTFAHLKPFEDPNRLGRRISIEQKTPEVILHEEAKKALSLMYEIALTRM